MVYNKLADWRSWLFPNECLLCQQQIPAEQDFCSPCETTLPYRHRACPRCAAALPASAAAAAICGACHKNPPIFTQSYALFSYQAPIDKLIQQFKYNKKLYLARTLGQMMARTMTDIDLQRPDVLLPVPLHRQRLRQRGFNQALELARPVARELGIPLDPWLAIRHKATAPQASLSPKERYRNVRGAFQVKKDVSGLKIAIIDDVMTTGHTVNAVAQALLRSGAAEVRVWVLARA